MEFRSAIHHYIDFCQKQDFKKLQNLIEARNNLPIALYKQRIVKAVLDNQVIFMIDSKS